MRFSGPDDETLPQRIRALAKERRVAFVNAYNEAGDDPEQAMKVAMTAIEDTLCRCGKELDIAKGADKADCSSCRRNYKVAWRDVKDSDDYGMCCPVLAEVYKPLGGATSFTEADQFYAAAEIDNNVWAQRYNFEDICRNIWDSLDLSMTEKASAIAAAAQDLASRIAAGPANKSLADRAKDMLRGFRTMTKEESGVSYKASDYADVVDDNDPATWNIRMADGSGTFTVASIAEAIKQLQPKGLSETAAVLGDTKETVVGKIAGVITRLDAPEWQKSRLRERLSTVKEVAEPGAFFVTKDVNDAWRWLAIYSNHWQDRDGEIFSSESHKEFEEYVARTKDYPEAWVWHVPGSRFGVADRIAYDDSGFMLSSGTFDKGMEHAAEALAAVKEPLGISHGYEYLNDDLTQEGVYERYRSKEISVLPLAKAANLWTLFSLTEKMKEADIMFRTEQRPMLVEVLGAEKVAEIETSLANTAKQISDAGICYKDFRDLLAPTAAKEEGEPAPAATEQAAAGDSTAGNPNTHVIPEQPLTLDAITAAIGAAIAPLQTALTSVQGEVKELQKTKDEVIAEALTGQRPPTGERPSESTATELTEEQQKAVGEALKEEGEYTGPVAPYMKQLLGTGAGIQQN